jgi:hypothetical protein
MAQDHWLHGFNYNIEEWDADGLHCETLAICRQLAYARGCRREARRQVHDPQPHPAAHLNGQPSAEGTAAIAKTCSGRLDALRTAFGTKLTVCSVLLFVAGSQGNLGRF